LGFDYRFRVQVQAGEPTRVSAGGEQHFAAWRVQRVKKFPQAFRLIGVIHHE
jgi:hypothetical protein